MSDTVLGDIDRSLIRSRATRGVAFLFLRYTGIRLLGLAANIVLSRLLSPEAFGIYAITLFLLVLLSFVGDFGLSASLLQQRKAITDADVRTVFTAQQVLVGSLLVILFVLAPLLASAYHLGDSGVWFIRLMLIAGLLTSLRTAPTIILERQLRYGQLSLVEIIDFGLFQLVAVVLAFLGFGVWSFLFAVLAAKLASAVLAYGLARWQPAFGFDRGRFAGLWRFGLPFQLSWLTFFLRDYMIPILGGLLVTTAQVGYLNWALALAGVPGQLAQVVGRVTLPAFARYQDQPRALARAVESSIRGLFLTAIPLHLGLVALAPWLIHLVFSDKWLPALPALYLLTIHWSGANLTSPLVSTLNAMGHARLALALSAAWMAATFLLAVIFLHEFGFLGMALAYSVTMIGACLASIVTARRYLELRLWREIRAPLGAAILACGACFLARHQLHASLVNLVLLILATGIAYAGILWLIEGRRIQSELHMLFGRPLAASVE
jgi:O-antigen/teichoic acid export membrane protein